MGPFVQLSDVEEGKMKGPAREKWDHTVPSEQKREIKEQFQVHFSLQARSWELGNQRYFLIHVFREVTERKPQIRGMVNLERPRAVLRNYHQWRGVWMVQ